MNSFATNQENLFQQPVRFNMPDVSVMEKLIHDIIYITGHKTSSPSENEDLFEQPWFEESNEIAEVHLKDDDDETLLASLAL